jgi:hypothetical protein
MLWRVLRCVLVLCCSRKPALGWMYGSLPYGRPESTTLP